ncbi:hypothetical protein BVX94_03560 [bacterium B17]|nr:hypothetical protein BVX94_03560 [bacterium B17]
MKKRILLSSAIGGLIAGVLYPVRDPLTQIIAGGVAFSVLLVLLCCTMCIGLRNKAACQDQHKEE